MSWGELPILPLCKIYKYLSNEDVINASSCCKNWRYALQIHRLPRDHLQLKINHNFLYKNDFLCNVFARSIKDLDIVLASSVDEYSRAISTVLSRFEDSKNLKYVKIIPTIEYLIYENTHSKAFIAGSLLPFMLKICLLPSLKEFNVNGCTELIHHATTIMETIKEKKQVETLGFGNLKPITDISYFDFKVLHQFTSLQSLSMDYLWLDNNKLIAMKQHIPYLRNLVLNISSVPKHGFIDLSEAWTALINQNSFLEVTINCICLPPECIVDINEKVMTRNLPLKTLRVLFCKTMNMDFLRKLSHYSIHLKELVWVDSITHPTIKTGGATNARPRNSRRSTRQQTPNPLVMMCWQCQGLTKITLHGYWHSAHDLLGMALLRGRNLQRLDISALLPFIKSTKPRQPFSPARLSFEESQSDSPYLADGFIRKMRSSLKYPWCPPVWNDLHPALRSDPNESLALQHEYIIDLTKDDLKIN